MPGAEIKARATLRPTRLAIGGCVHKSVLSKEKGSVWVPCLGSRIGASPLYKERQRLISPTLAPKDAERTRYNPVIETYNCSLYDFCPAGDRRSVSDMS